jgi:hypothetical protein
MVGFGDKGAPSTPQAATQSSAEVEPTALILTSAVKAGATRYA